MISGWPWLPGIIPVSQIASTITKELIEEKLAIFNQSLKQDFAIDAPRIAVLSLNPHAGDEGLLGKEEEEIIIPALKEMSAEASCAMDRIRLTALWVQAISLILTVCLPCTTIRDWHRSKHWRWTKV